MTYYTKNHIKVHAKDNIRESHNEGGVYEVDWVNNCFTQHSKNDLLSCAYTTHHVGLNKYANSLVIESAPSGLFS